MVHKLASDVWPQDLKGRDLPTQIDPITQLPFCRECWDGNHKRGGVPKPKMPVRMLRITNYFGEGCN